MIKLFQGKRGKLIKDYNIYVSHLKRKKGLEIGGPSWIFRRKSPLPIYTIISALDGCNFSENTVWHGEEKEGNNYRYLKHKRKGHRFICDAVDLKKIKSGAYDFILSSHVIEHIANPFKAISEWLRVIKDEGIIVIVAPHKDATFDHKRPVTLLSHLIDDFEKDIKEDDLTHLPEILQLHDLSLDPPSGDIESFKKRSLKNYENRCLHQHVFNTKLVIDIFEYFNLQILSVETLLPNNVIVMGKKRLSNNIFLSDNAEYKRTSYFESDRE